MKKLVVVAVVAGCWSSSKPASEPSARAPEAAPRSAVAASTGGNTYGGDAYGGTAHDQAYAAGILGSTALTQGGAFASLTGPGDLSGVDGVNIYGGLIDDEAGTGGGGTGVGTIGTGRYGTIGTGSGTGSGYGSGRGGMRGRSAAIPTVRLGQATVTGALDAAIIRRYLKRNIQKVHYCYEVELLASPKLAGTMTATFTIAGTGLVSSAVVKGVHPNVEACVAKMIQALEFPKPRDLRDVQVSYPITFAPAP